MTDKVQYIQPIQLKKRTVDRIQKALKKHEYGMTINNMMVECNLARGTIKTYLTALVYAGEVKEIIYNQNTKVYFWID